MLDRLHPKSTTRADGQKGTAEKQTDSEAEPSLDDATAWINSPPLRLEQLRGKVVLVDFWTYSCINCLRSIPYVRAWADKYGPNGLVVVGVHIPEFAFEKDLSNVRKAVRDLHMTYPVAVDNEYEIWSAFDNEYWPAHYFIDVNGRIRHKHFGEGAIEQSEQWIQQLLSERTGQTALPGGTISVRATGAEAAADGADIHSPETYVGYQRAKNFASLGGFKRDEPSTYQFPAQQALNNWAFAGNWMVKDELATVNSTPARLRFKFHARDLHLVMGLTAGQKQLRYRVTLDGHVPGESHGMDTNEMGDGVLTEHRLYQLIRQKGSVNNHVFEIDFSGAGAQVFAFTFG